MDPNKLGLKNKTRQAVEQLMNCLFKIYGWCFFFFNCFIHCFNKSRTKLNIDKFVLHTYVQDKVLPGVKLIQKKEPTTTEQKKTEKKNFPNVCLL